jgi:hypothetical protein
MLLYEIGSGQKESAITRRRVALVIVVYYNSDWKAVPARERSGTKKNRKVVNMVSEGGE